MSFASIPYDTGHLQDRLLEPELSLPRKLLRQPEFPTVIIFLHKGILDLPEASCERILLRHRVLEYLSLVDVKDELILESVDHEVLKEPDAHQSALLVY